MSYYAFTKAVADELLALNSQNGAPTDYEIVNRRVFDRWLAYGRHEALIRYVLENFDGATGGERYIKALGKELARIERPELIRKLYAQSSAADATIFSGYDHNINRIDACQHGQ
jgi:hypothetical protein